MRFLAALLTIAILAASLPTRAFVWPTRAQGWQQEFPKADVTRRRAIIRDVRDAYSGALYPVVKQALLDSDRQVRLLAAETVALRRLALTELLIPWLSQSDDEAKLAAVRVLQRVVDPAGARELAKACGDRDVRIRQAAVRALSRYTGEIAARGLAAALSDPEAQVRLDAVEALARRDEPIAFRALNTRLTDLSDAVRARSVWAIAVQSPTDATTPIEAALRDPSSRVRTSAAEALSLFSQIKVNDRIKESLLTLISDEQPLDVLEHVLGALLRDPNDDTSAALWDRWLHLTHDQARGVVETRIGGVDGMSDQLAHWCQESLNPHLWQRCLGFYGPGTKDPLSLVRFAERFDVDRVAAMQAVAKTADPRLVAWVLAELESADPRVTAAGLDALAKLQLPETAGRVLDSLLGGLARSPREPSLDVALLRQIGRTGSPRAWPALDAVLVRSDVEIPTLVAAVGAAADVPNRNRVSRLLHLLGHPRGEVAREAARVLFRSRETAALPTLLAVLGGGAGSLEVALAASGLLAHSNDENVLRQVLDLLPRLDWTARDALIEGLARNGSTAALSALETLIASASRADRAKIAESLPAAGASHRILLSFARDEDPRVRENAIWSLGRVGIDLDLPVIESALHDPHAEIVANALVALGRIAARESRPVSPLSCPYLNHPVAQIREAALSSLRIARQRCDESNERRLLLEDPDSHVRAAAGWALAAASRNGSSNALDARVLRWCSAFEPDETVRSKCRQSLKRSDETRSERSRNAAQANLGALVFVAAPRGASIETAIGLERPDGLVRYATTDHRGAVFEPDCLAEGSTLRAPIAQRR